MSEMQFDYHRSDLNQDLTEWEQTWTSEVIAEPEIAAVFGSDWPNVKKRLNGSRAEKIEKDGWLYWSEEAMRYV